MGEKNGGWRLACMAIAWLVGVGLHLQQRELVPWRACAWVAAGLACALLAWRLRGKSVLLAASMALLGAGLCDWRAGARLADELPPALEGEDLQIVGVVSGLPQTSSIGLRFRFEVEEAHLQDRRVRVPRHLMLGWYVGWHEGAVLSETQRALRAGQRWRFEVRLRRPHGQFNPQGFDYELHLFEQGLRATGQVRDGASQLLEPHAGYPIERWRQHVRDAIHAQVTDPRAAGVLAALVVGDQSAIERDDWQLFRDTGVAHLMSISGLHVTMFAWMAALAIGGVWRRSARAALWMPALSAGRLGGLAAAGAYALFSGWGVPAQRTLWMLAAVTALQVLGKRWPWPLVLLLAAVAVTALDPWALLQPGFWLSFAAVGLLMASEPVRRADRSLRLQASPWRRQVAAALRTQVVATVGLAPLSLVFFHQISLVGFVANLVAIPLVTLVITPLALLGVVHAPVWQAGAWVEQGLAAGLAWLGSLPGAVWWVPAAPWWAQWAGLCGGACLLLPWPWRMRLLALPLLAPLLLPVRDLPGPGQFDLLAVDVGQGTSVVLRTRGHVLLYDAGPQYSRESDAGQRVLLPLLRSRGDARVDRLVLSHRDLDHVGGAAVLLRTLPVHELLSSLEDGHALRALAQQDVRCEAGQSWQWDGVRFEVLHPRAAAYERKQPSNAMSCVIKVTGSQGTALLAGDIERQQEIELVASHAQALRSDVLMVPHHGSRTSSTQVFIEAVRPRMAVVQAGYRSRFGHPNPGVLDRLQAAGVVVLASPACGAWSWRSGAPAGICERERVRRYWHHIGATSLDLE